MNSTLSFHEVQFPNDFALGATGGPIRRTEVITLGSGKEQRNARWAHSRRRYNAGYGIKTFEDLQAVIEFFEERRGRLFGFRFKDPLDYKSSQGKSSVSSLDQLIATGDGTTTSFELTKRYGDEETGYVRRIQKPVVGTVKVAVDDNPVPDNDFMVDWVNGKIEFNSGKAPGLDQAITAGFEFDIPVRFDADEIIINMTHFEAGDIPSIPLVELLL
jgi:uncharacterized protein (TIGR02217 family)